MTCDLVNGRLLNACQVGRAGIKSLYFTKFNDFDALTGITETGGEITSLGTDPISIYQFDLGSNVGNFEEIPNVSRENGTSYIEQVITLTLFQVKPADLANLNSLKKGRWTIWALDFQDKIRLFGRPRGMFATSGSDVSGAGPGDKKGVDIVFNGVNDNISIFMQDYTTVPFDNFTNVTVVKGGYSAEYQIIYNAMTNKPTASIAAAQNTMVEALISAGVWAKLDVFYMLAQYSNAASEALINWINPGTNDATLQGTPNPAFVSLEGFTSDGANGYIDTGFNPNTEGSNFTLNSASYGCYYRTNVSETVAEMGAQDATPNYLRVLILTGGTSNYMLNQTDTAAATGITDSRGLWIVNRPDSGNVYFYQNNSELDTEADASSAIPSLNMYLLCQNNNGSPGSKSTKQMAAAFYGASLDNTERAALQSAIETYMDSNGKGVIS